LPDRLSHDRNHHPCYEVPADGLGLFIGESGARNPTFWKSRVSGWASKRSISDFIKQVKGSYSHSIDHEIRSDRLFKWQGSYGALTVSKSGVDDLCEYIDGQEEHHRRKSLILDWEPI
jgi:Transposase IS200 like